MVNTNNVNTTVSNEKRADLIRLVQQTGNIKTAAVNLDIKYENARKIIQKYNNFGQIHKSQAGGNKPKNFTTIEIDFIKEKIVDNCSTTLKKLKGIIIVQYNNDISRITISKYIKDPKYSFKRIHVVTKDLFLLLF